VLLRLIVIMNIVLNGKNKIIKNGKKGILLLSIKNPSMGRTATHMAV